MENKRNPGDGKGMGKEQTKLVGAVLYVQYF